MPLNTVCRFVSLFSRVVSNPLTRIFALFTIAVMAAHAQAAHFGGVQTTASLPFFSYGGVVADPSGNLYVADNSNRQIVEYTATGKTVDISTGGAAPEYMALDQAGNLYVTTTGATGVMKITPSGTNTVIATAFTTPWGIAVDSNGNVFVADHATSVIYRLTPILAGSYVQTTFLKAGTLAYPVQLGMDAANNLYVADRGNNRIVVVSPTGAVSTPFPSVAAPSGVASDASGNVAITGNAGLTYEMKLDSSSYQTTLLASTFTTPYGVTFDNSGNMFVVDDGAQQLVHQTAMTADLGAAQAINLLLARKNGGSTTAQVAFVFDANTTLASSAPVQVLQTWSSDLWWASPEFMPAGGNCTAGANFTAGETCLATIAFTPAYSGKRQSSASLLSDSGTVATAPLQGLGLGGQMVAVTKTVSQNIASASTSNNPVTAIALDISGNVFALSSSNYSITKTPALGTTPSTVASNVGATSFAVDTTGNVLYTNGQVGKIYKLTAASGYKQTQVVTSGPNKMGPITLDISGNIFVVEQDANQVQELVAASGYKLVRTLATTLPGTVTSLGVDSKGNLFAVVSGTTIFEAPAGGRYAWKSLASGLVNTQLAVDGNDNLYYTATISSGAVIMQLPAAGNYTTKWTFPAGTTPWSAIAVAPGARVYVAQDPATAKNGNVYQFALSTANLNFALSGSGARQGITWINNGNQATSFGRPPSSPTSSIALVNSTTACGGITPLATGGSCTVAFSYTPACVGLTAIEQLYTTSVGSLPVMNFNAQPKTVCGGAQTITFPLPESVGVDLYQLNATASSELPVTYTYTTTGLPGRIFPLSGNVLMASPRFVYTVYANQAGNSEWHAAPTVSVVITSNSSGCSARTATGGATPMLTC